MTLALRGTAAKSQEAESRELRKHHRTSLRSEQLRDRGAQDQEKELKKKLRKITSPPAGRKIKKKKKKTGWDRGQS